jgi:hypothetical protein
MFRIALKSDANVIRQSKFYLIAELAVQFFLILQTHSVFGTDRETAKFAHSPHPDTVANQNTPWL